MVRHKEQRVGVFIDVQNMYYSAKQLYNSKVNFTHILNEAVAGRKLVRAMAYAITADIKEEAHFYDALTNIGFEVRLKELQIFLGGAKKGDWDVGLAMDIIRMVNKLDVVVLVSGDGDFKDLVEYVQANGCRAEVMAFAKTTSSKLKDEADMFIDMGQNLRQYLIGKIPPPKRPSSFNRNDEQHNGNADAKRDGYQNDIASDGKKGHYNPVAELSPESGKNTGSQASQGQPSKAESPAATKTKPDASTPSKPVQQTSNTDKKVADKPDSGVTKDVKIRKRGGLLSKLVGAGKSK